jgi:hypothetical protein
MIKRATALSAQANKKNFKKPIDRLIKLWYNIYRKKKRGKNYGNN